LIYDLGYSVKVRKDFTIFSCS